MQWNDANEEITRRSVMRTGVAAAGALTVGTGSVSAAGGGDDQNGFISVQRPENAVPPAEPVQQEGARGLSLFFLDRKEEHMFWKLFLDDIENVTGVHIHRGAADENGPHLVELFNVAEPTDEIDGFLDRGVFGVGDACTEADFPVPNDCITQPGQPSGPPEEVTFEQVVAEMRSGDTYVQVHTPERVMRGQIH